MAEEMVEVNSDADLVDKIGLAVTRLQEFVNDAADRGIVITIEQASQDVNNGITKPVFAFRGAVKRLLTPKILRL